MKQIVIENSVYNKKSKRLVVSYRDETGRGWGTRIVGGKFNNFLSDKEISVPLTIEQAKELVKELEELIKLEEELK